MAFAALVNDIRMNTLPDHDIKQRLRNIHLVFTPQTRISFPLKFPGGKVEIIIRSDCIRVFNNRTLFYARKRKFLLEPVFIQPVFKQVSLFEFGHHHLSVLQVVSRCGYLIYQFGMFILSVQRDNDGSQIAKSFFVQYLNPGLALIHIGKPGMAVAYEMNAANIRQNDGARIAIDNGIGGKSKIGGGNIPKLDH